MSTNYAQDVIDALNRHLPGQDPEIIRNYALLALALGEDTTGRDVHNAWAMWRSHTRPDHPDLVPFDELTPEIQAYDDEYVDAIHEVVLELDLP